MAVRWSEDMVMLWQSVRHGLRVLAKSPGLAGAISQMPLTDSYSSGSAIFRGHVSDAASEDYGTG